MNNVFPIEPKRRAVSPRNWMSEPENRKLRQNTYRSRMYGNINPWITRQLHQDEQFQVTYSDLYGQD